MANLPTEVGAACRTLANFANSDAGHNLQLQDFDLYLLVCALANASEAALRRSGAMKPEASTP